MRPGRDSLASLGTPERLGDLPMVPIPAGAPIFEQRLEYFSPEYAAPRYAGNISETSWSRADTARMTYVYAYDRLGRLVDGHCTTGAAPSARHYGERNITYDKNSNILSLDRYNGAIAAPRYRYSYDGNRILTVGMCRTSPVGQTPVTEYAYRYDSMGNVTFNGAEALQVSYNYRNLPKRATKADMRAATGSASTYVVGVAPHVVQNLYLADGTKVRATNDRGRGYEYLGSLSRTFLSPRHSPNEFGSALGLTKRSLRLNVNGEEADIESIPFAGGRIVKTSNVFVKPDKQSEVYFGFAAARKGRMKFNGYEPHYYVTDHLGSTRAIVRPAASGVEIMAEYDYMPYGTQHIVAEAPTADADYKYTGKEQQGAFGMYSLYDSQARFQNVTSGCFLSQDPLSGSFPGISPYIYCGGDPINRADPDGKKIRLSGICTSDFITLLQSATGNCISLYIDEFGDIKYNDNTADKDRTKNAYTGYAILLMNIIDDDQVNIQINTTDQNLIDDKLFVFAGAMLGAEYYEDNGIQKAQTIQLVNPSNLKSMDAANNCIGKTAMHEVSESYQAGKIAIEMKQSANYKDKSINDIYSLSHFMATPQSPSSMIRYDINGTIIDNWPKTKKIEIYSNYKLIFTYSL